MSTATQPTETAARQIAPISTPNASVETGYLVDTGRFEHLWRVASSFAKSDLVPDVFKCKPDNCFIAAQLSVRLGVDLFALMQNTYIVHGKPGFEAKLVIGLLNASDKTVGPVRYRFSGEGDDYGCEAVVIDAWSKEELVGPKVDWKLVKAEGWNKPRSGQPSKWATMPELMFRYRAAMFLARVHYPEVMLGIQTRDELEDQVVDVQATATPTSLDLLTDDLESKAAESPADTSQKKEEPAEVTYEATPAMTALERFAAATTIRECAEINEDYQSPDRADLPQPQKDAIRKLCDTRMGEIRAARGNGSNKPKPADDRVPTEPTPKQLAQRTQNYAARIAKAGSGSALESVWGDIDSDGDLLEADKQELRELYEKKREELG